MTKPIRIINPGRSQRGVAALAVSLVLLFGMTLVAFFVNRGLLFEQKTSANQTRATQAFEVADAGIEWATARLNDNGSLNTSTACTSTLTTSFKDTYAPKVGSPSNLTPPANARAACRITAGALICSCPAAGGTLSVGSSTDPNFVVEITDEPLDPDSIRITSRGCINQSAACTAGLAGGDAVATVSVTLKLLPIVRAAPAAALTTGGYAQVCASFNISNASTVANGYLVNSGGQIQMGNSTYLSGPLPNTAATCGGGGGQTLTTTPGTPLASAMVASDTSLSSIAGTSDGMFSAFFGTTLNQFKDIACTVTGGTAAARATNLLSLYSGSQRCRDFWIDGDIQFSGNGTLGSATDPVTMVSSSDMTFNGNYDIYGVVYSDSTSVNALGTGTSNVYGAMITRGDYRNNGNGTIAYDPSVLGQIQDRGRMLRVPGTWRDF